MTGHTILAEAGNTLAPALAVLIALGYTVTRGSSDSCYRAQNNSHIFIADDPLSLLGLVKLHEVRGEHWQASNADIDMFLSLEI